MSTKACNVCGRRLTIRSKDWKLLDLSGDFVCSKQCVQAWIDNPHSFILEADDIIGDFGIDRPSEAYSMLLKKYFRSNYERAVAEWLYGLSHFALYESVAFKMKDGKTYIPDFYLPGICFLEVKGLWGISQKFKLFRFREQFPKVPILVLTWLIHGDFYDKRDGAIG